MSGRILFGAAVAAIALASQTQAARADCNTAQSASEQHLGQAVVDVAAGGLVQGDNFMPCNVTIDAGSAVHWAISPSGGHTVTSDSSAPEQFNFTGDGGTFTFTTPGSYFYYCAFHGTSGAPGTGMVGVVYVQGQGGTPPPPPPPKFPGLKLVSHTVHVTRSRVAPVRVTCPAGTAGSCAGKLTLSSGAAKATKSLAIQPGATATVKLRLSRSEFKKLRRRRKLRVRLAFAVHDGNGTASAQPGTTLTLKAPREG